ncbi:autotransporter outer membrane beta-barrel domain-containing protein [Cardiobacteriaceae bacterium TAE3-ERU3]|nr:autotransporter outer membrane beta-barrel domain-containing protein [Cardiobacteriaceae bacterium TAE3-ERU3]
MHIPNLKPTLLASVITAAIYTPDIQAYSCSLNSPSNFSLFHINNGEYEGNCTIDNGRFYMNLDYSTIEFNTPLTVTSIANAPNVPGRGKGAITSGNHGNLIFNDTVTIQDTENADRQRSPRLILIRNKKDNYGGVEKENSGVTFKGDNNILSIAANATPYFYTGAAIANYNYFAALNSDYKTTINNTGTVNGINQNYGKLIFEQDLTINSQISQLDSLGAIKRQNAAILISGGTAEFGKVTINTDISDLTQTPSEGAGLISHAYEYEKSLFGHARGTGEGSDDAIPQSTFNKDLTINTHNGAAIQFTHGKIEQSGSKATINVSGDGHGIAITDEAGGLLADNTTKSKFNWIQLAGGALTFVDGKTQSDAPNQLTIGLGENTTITTNNGDGINIANIPEDNIKHININNTGIITAENGDAIDLSLLEPDPSIQDDKAQLTAARTINIINGATLSAQSGYSLYGSNYNESFTSNGGKLVGKIDMQNGWDTVKFDGSTKAVDISELTELNGGLDSNSNNEFDTLTLIGNIINPANGFNGSQLTNWEKIELTEEATLALTGPDPVKIGDKQNDSGLFIDQNTTLISKGDSTTIVGNVSNQGTIELDNDSGAASPTFNTLTIDGDYEGGGKVKLHTLLTDNPQTDKLILKGNVSGETEVEVVKVNKPGEEPTKADTNGIQLIDTSTATMPITDADKSFTLSSDVEAGAYLYNKLAYKKNEGFYLQSKRKPSDDNSIQPDEGQNPDEGQTPDEGQKSGKGNSNDSNHGAYQPEVYRPAVAGYSVAQLANRNAVIGMLGNHLHQRVDEQQVLNWNDDHNDQQIWGRIRHESLSLNGKQRFDLDQKTQYAQLGWDLDINRDNQNSRQHSGIYVAYAHANADISDRARITLGQQSFTGKIRGDIYGVGGYHTRYDEDGNYVDLIGGIHFINNKYSDVLNGNSNQKGWGLSASAEAGMPITVSDSDHGNWFIEPQAELTWQMTNYHSFKDGITEIDGYNSHSLRPRLGLRFGYNDKPADREAAKDFHLTASIVHELIAPTQVTVGGTDIKEDIGKDTWLEIGAGGQFPINKSTYIYGSAQYLHTLNNNTRRGITGQVGIRHSW